MFRSADKLLVLFLTCSSLSVTMGAKDRSADIRFSGFYIPDSKQTAEDFSAAWLVSKERFLQAETKIVNAANMAGTSFAVVRDRCFNSSTCYGVMTRDYFDFMVEHLSPMSNQLPNNNKDLFSLVHQQLNHTAQKLRDLKPRKMKDNRPGQTLGVLIYSSISFSVAQTIEQELIRHTYFESTFFSVLRYFKKIVIFVANQKDRDTVNNMNLPYYQLITIPAPLDARNKTTALPRMSLHHIIRGMQNNDEVWSWVKYVYFTEGDQIVHMRAVKSLFDMIDDSLGLFAVIPHRMQMLPLRQTFPSELHSVWPVKHVQRHMPNVTIVTETLGKITGSCCDAGRNVYDVCGTQWWYTCPTFGLANFTTWLRIGRSGYTFPTSSEHKGVCTYSKKKQLCDIPHDCMSRLPVLRDHVNRFGVAEKSVVSFCREIPVVNRIGAFPTYPDY